MKPCATVLFLIAAGLSTAAPQPEWLENFRRSGEELLQQMEQVRQKVDGQIAELGQDSLATVPETADDSLPPAREGYAVAVADGGMLVDRTADNVTYIGNVRLNEARLQLRCRNRVYLLLTSSTMKRGEKRAINGDMDTPPPAEAAVPPAEKAAQAPAPAAPRKPVKKTATAPQKGQPAQAEAPAKKEQEPVIASAHDAMVDSKNNNLLIRSEGAKGIPHIKQGGREVCLTPRTDGKDTYLLADSNGNAHLHAGSATLHWVDEQGRPGTLVAEQGRLEFNRADNTLYVDGPARLAMPDGFMLTCRESLCAKLHPSPGTETNASGAFMAQFTAMRFDGVEHAEAYGDVHASRPALEGRPAATASGDVCTYNGKTGECSLRGKDCTLTYGPQQLHTQDSITLEANGDIIIHGQVVTGTYELPATGADGKPAKGLPGTFRTAGEVQFHAEDGTVTIPAGMQAKDPQNHFHCTGPLVLQLKRSAEKAPSGKNSGMLNLAVADYDEVASVDARGDVDIHYRMESQGKVLDIHGEHAFFNVELGTALVESAPGQAAKLDYGQNKIIAYAAGESVASMSVDEQGDIDVRGGKIHADMPFQKQQAVVDCTSYLRLEREFRTLRLGPQSKLVYPGGILTANGPTEALLSCDDQVPAPRVTRYPHLSYNYTGVEKASTKQGGTLRTEKASMECKGDIVVNVAQAPGKKAEGDSDGLENIHATASQDVSILLKDSTGRIIRATGDDLVIDGAAGTKVLTGRTVSLADKNNTHTATGKGARVTVDRKNNARIQGERHLTTATHLHEQMGKPDGKEEKPHKEKKTDNKP